MKKHEIVTIKPELSFSPQLYFDYKCQVCLVFVLTFKTHVVSLRKSDEEDQYITRRGRTVYSYSLEPAIPNCEVCRRRREKNLT